MTRDDVAQIAEACGFVKPQGAVLEALDALAQQAFVLGAISQREADADVCLEIHRSDGTAWDCWYAVNPNRRGC